MPHNVRMASLACNLPSRLMRNDDPAFAEVEPIESQWWQFWGIESRYVIDPQAGESELTLAEHTARQALERAGIEAAALDLVLFNSTSPFVTAEDEQSGPSTDAARRFAPRLSGTLCERLGAHRALNADVEMECASFALQLQIAANFIKQGRARYVLVCSSERMSALVDYTSKSSTNFGDGAAAAVLVADEASADGADWLDAVYRSDATHYGLATMRWRGAHERDEPAPVERGDRYGVYFTLAQQAQQLIARFMPEAIPDIVNRLLHKNGLRTQDIDAMVFHQPSKILVNAWAQRLGLKPEQYVVRVADCACLVSAAVALALNESIERGIVRPGGLVVIATAGAGWGFGAQLWRWGETAVAPQRFDTSNGTSSDGI